MAITPVAPIYRVMMQQRRIPKQPEDHDEYKDAIRVLRTKDDPIVDIRV